MKNLKIYFTSDLHGYIYPTNYVDRSEKNIGLLNIINQYHKDENTLIIDAGDTIQGSPFTNYLNNKDFDIHPIANIFNHGGLDYITLGNHDFNYGYNYLSKYLDNLNAKCLCCNVEDKTKNLDILPYDIKTMENGLNVGVIGFTTDFINMWERPENIENFSIEDTFSNVKINHDKIKDEVDVLIGIYHGGFEYDLESHNKLSSTKENIAYKISKELDFDILLTGHQHMEIMDTEIFNTHIVQTPHNGSKFIELNLEFDGTIKNITSTLKDVELDYDKEMYNKYLPLEEEVQQWLDTPVGHLDTPLTPSSHLDMALQGSELANFINQIQLEESGADIACTSFANVIKGFDSNVTVRDIMSTYMYPNTLVIKEVQRKDLKLALERCASYFDYNNGDIKISDLFLKPKVEHYNYDYFANIKYKFDITRESGDRVTSIVYDGKELDESTKLNLVMNNYRASGAGGYECYDDCRVVKEIMVEMPEVIIDYFRKNSNVVVDKSKYLSVKY